MLALCEKLACSVRACGAQLELNVLSPQTMCAGMTLEVSDVEESGPVRLAGVRTSDGGEHSAIAW